MEKWLFLYFQCLNLLKIVHSVPIIKFKQILFLHTECIKHDLDLVYGIVVISVFQYCNLLKIVHSVPII